MLLKVMEATLAEFHWPMWTVTMNKLPMSVAL
jgi:hypothetical protein